MKDSRWAWEEVDDDPAHGRVLRKGRRIHFSVMPYHNIYEDLPDIVKGLNILDELRGSPVDLDGVLTLARKT